MSDEYLQANITGHQYERICAKILKEKGFTDIEVTRGSHDFGVDVVAKKDGKKYAVQCKYYSDSQVKPDAVQQVVAGKSVYGCDSAIVMTNSEFTDAAKELAKANDVILWPHHEVVLKGHSVDGQERSSRSSTERKSRFFDRSERGSSTAVSKRLVVLIVVVILAIIFLILILRSPAVSENNFSGDTADTTETASYETTGDLLSSDYILPESDTRYYTESELSGLSKEELRLARNEIYARHGRKFEAEDLQEYFNGKSWYNGTIEPADFSDSVFNQYEKANLETILQAES